MKNLTIAGRIGKDAVGRSTKGDTVTNFNVAVDRPFNKQAGPLWISVSLWGTRGEKLEQYLTKGKVVSVSGEMDIQTYTNKSGEEVTQVVLNANQVTLLGGGSEREESTDDSAEDDSDESRAGF
jgi:single-strand DNA-binding protein